MKINYDVTATLTKDQIFALIKEAIEKKTDKHLANIVWNKNDATVSCQLVFCTESVDIE